MAQIIQYKDRTNDVSVFPITTASAVYCNIDTDSSLCTLDNVLNTKIEGQEIYTIEKSSDNVHYVTTVKSQGLSTDEQLNARENIGVEDILIDLINNINSKELNINLKQDKLYHSTSTERGNIKTINGAYILGPGNVDIFENENNIGLDDTLDANSHNAIKNSTVSTKFNEIDITISELPFKSSIGEFSAAMETCIANGDHSIAGGHNTITTNDNEVAIGKFNKSNQKTSFSIGNGISEENRCNALEVYDDMLYVYGIGGYDGTNPTGSKDITDIINIKNITYNDLLSLYTTNSLIPGKKYKIIDYTPKFSINNRIYPIDVRFFDIIVTALSPNTLSEDVYLIKKDVVEYGEKTPYCIDNTKVLEGNNKIYFTKIYTNEDGTSTGSNFNQAFSKILIDGISNIGENGHNNVYSNKKDNSLININFSDYLKNNIPFNADVSILNEYGNIITKNETDNTLAQIVLNNVNDPEYTHICQLGDIYTEEVTEGGKTTKYLKEFSLDYNINVFDNTNQSTKGPFTITFTNTIEDNIKFVWRDENLSETGTYGEEGYYPFYMSSNSSGGTDPESLTLQNTIKSNMLNRGDIIYRTYGDRGVVYIYGTPESIITNFYNNIKMWSTTSTKLVLLTNFDYENNRELQNVSTQKPPYKTLSIRTYTHTEGTETSESTTTTYHYMYHAVLHKNLFKYTNNEIVTTNDKIYYDNLNSLLNRPINAKYSIIPLSRYYDKSSTGQILEISDYNGNLIHFDFLNTYFNDGCNETLAFKPTLNNVYGITKNIKFLNNIGLEGIPYCSFDNCNNITLLNYNHEDIIELNSNNNNEFKIKGNKIIYT